MKGAWAQLPVLMEGSDLGVKQLYRVLEYSLGFFKNNRTRNKSEYSFMVHAFTTESAVSEQQSADIDVQTVWGTFVHE